MALWRKKSPSGPPPGGASPVGGDGAVGGPGETGSGSRPTELLSGDPLEDRASVRVLLDAIARVSESRDLESLLDYVVDSSVQATGAERGFLILIDDETGEQTVRVARERDPAHSESGRALTGDVKYSTTVVSRVLEEGVPVRTTVQSDAEALELGTSVFDLKLRAVMCVLLTPHEGEGISAGGQQPGALYVDSKAATREFGDQDLSLFFALAQHIAIALENARLNIQSLEKARLERSLEIASEIQTGLMPKAPPTHEGYDIFGWFRPAEHATGDFYDFVETRDERLAVVIGDVTGHGIGPALITATAQASLRAYAKVLPDPGSVVTMLNHDLAERIDDGMFLTLFMGLFGADGALQIVNAGHTPPLIWRHESGTIESIPGTGPALGLDPAFDYENAPSITLAPGDTLLVFTDGLVEARHRSRPDRFFGEEGIRAVMAEIALTDPTSEALAESLIQSVLEFSEGVREDDMTVVVVRRAK